MSSVHHFNEARKYSASMLPEKWSWKVLWLLGLAGRWNQARCKDSAKVIVRFIRKGYTFNRLKAGCL
jgi:hypothetical protein